ncbi:MAG: hypothetical protein A3I75_06535 [Deltaproteobacteria bacterium RIFCSPLOWO2_02_FULL_50_16]|nr:MAG: hypothetical protein A3I75_06535 [Deltaproteobacteria bacterium RIFCSPLOWO2_02_FULL_50_16]
MRTTTGAELDYVEERDGKIFGYEFKFKSKKSRPPASWAGTYQGAEYQCIDRENYRGFIQGT